MIHNMNCKYFFKITGGKIIQDKHQNILLFSLLCFFEKWINPVATICLQNSMDLQSLEDKTDKWSNTATSNIFNTSQNPDWKGWSNYNRHTYS